MNAHSDDDEMLDEVDFSRGERGKHYRGNRPNRVVHVTRDDGTVEVHYFHTLEDTVRIDPDLLGKFPDAVSVNNALRAYLAASTIR